MLSLMLKRLDIGMQAVAFAVPIILLFIPEAFTFSLFYFYLSVSAAQVISCIVNYFFLSKQFRISGRTHYEVVLLFITLLLFVCWVTNADDVFMILYILLFAISPFLAIWYVYITVAELNAIKQINREV